MLSTMPSKKDSTLISRSLRSEIKKLKISEREKAFADLLTIGWANFDAYVITGLYNPVYSKEVNVREMQTLMESQNFSSYLKLATKRLKRKEKEEDEEEYSEMDMASELSKEHQLKELLIAKSKLAIGSPDWLKVKQMIADITQAKKEEIQTEDNTIHYYLPLTCYKCALYMKNKKKSGV